MGTSNSLHAFDVDACKQKLLPAYRALVDRKDGAPLAALLSAISRDLGDAEGLTKEEVEREIAAATASSEPERFDRMIANLKRRSGDPGRPTILTSQEAAEFARDLESPNKTHQEKLELLRVGAIQALVESLCFPWNLGFEPQINLSWTPLTGYLSQDSPWLANVLTGAGLSGRPLPVSTGEATVLFTAAELERFEDELSRVSLPQGDSAVSAELDHLRRLVSAVRSERRLALALTSH